MAEKRKITIHPSYGGKRVIASKPAKVEQQEIEVQVEDIKAQERKRSCSFCQNKSHPVYTDVAVLKRYISDRGKIVPRTRSGACSKHQRQITREIKHARHLVLLPFTPKV